MYAAVGSEAHEVDGLSAFLGIGECVFDLGIVHDRAFAYGLVDLDKILIHHSACTDVEVAHLGVAHLAVGEAYVLARSLELRVGIGSEK